MKLLTATILLLLTTLVGFYGYTALVPVPWYLAVITAFIGTVCTALFFTTLWASVLIYKFGLSVTLDDLIEEMDEQSSKETLS